MWPNLLPLFLAARLGDTVALLCLLETSRDPLFAYAHSRLDHLQDAEDVVQDAMLALWRCVHTTRQYQFADEAYFRAFVCVILSRTIKKTLLARGRFPEVVDEIDSLLSDRMDPTNEFECSTKADEARVVFESLDELEPKLRQVTSMFYMLGMTSAEIAERMDIPAATVRGRLVQARQQLLTIITRRAPQMAERWNVPD